MKIKISFCLRILLVGFLFACNSKTKIKENWYLTKFNPDTTNNYKALQNQFMIGSHLCRKPMPAMNELKHDMALLKKNGFNYIKIQTHWALDEPSQGKYDFAVYEELIKYADSLGLRIYVGLTCEQAPAWLWEKYPDCRMVGKNGVPISFEAPYTIPADGKPGPCFDSKDARDAMVTYIKALVNQLGKYKNVGLWNTWQEIEFWSERLAGTPVCYCPNTLEHFRRWLRFQYKSLDSLNKSWNTAFSDWKYVKPNMGESVGTRLDMDWHYFIKNIYMAQTLQARAAAIRETDAFKRPVFAHPSSATIGSGEDWTYARCQEFTGSSAYPGWSPFHPWDAGANDYPKDQYKSISAEMIDVLALNFDYIRSAQPKNHPIVAAELQGGPVTTDYGFSRNRFPDSNDIRRWMFTLIGSGVTGISFWVTRLEIVSQEANSFGLLDTQGDSSERFVEAGKIARALNKYPNLFARNNLEPGKVAILVNEKNWNFCSSLHKYAEHLSYSTRGWYRLLFNAGIPVDFIELSSLEDKKFGDYKAIIMPVPVSFSNDDAKKMADYVNNGGNLISEACPGRFTENGLSRRTLLSPIFQQLFGVEEKNLHYIREPESGRKWTPNESSWGATDEAATLNGIGSMNKIKLRGNVYLESFNLTNAVPVLTYKNDTVGAVNNFGKGKGWILGTFVGHNGNAYPDQDSQFFIKELLDQCGVQFSHFGKLTIRKRVEPEIQAWVITNPTNKTVTEKINCNGFSYVEDLLGAEVNKSGNLITATLKSCEVKILVMHK